VDNIPDGEPLGIAALSLQNEQLNVVKSRPKNAKRVRQNKKRPQSVDCHHEQAALNRRR
jgi:hypothetical protein